MRTIEDYMAMPYRMEIVEDSDEGGFVASYPDLPGCISCGETVEAAAANAQDAKRAWLEAAMEDGISPSGSRMIWKATPASSSCAFPKVCTGPLRSILSARA